MRFSRISCIRHHKRITFFLLGFLLVLSVLFSLGSGAVRLEPGVVLQVLLSHDTASVAGRVIWFTRLPRILAALLAGMGLAVSGALLQKVLHDPLASPNIIGVNAGAGFAVTLLFALAPQAIGWIPAAAFAGAALAVLIVVGLSELTGASRLTLMLAGVAVGSMFSAGVEAISTLVPGALSGYADFKVGGFSGVSLARLTIPAVIILAAVFLALTLSDRLDILSLGRETASSLGLPVRASRALYLALSAVLAGTVVSYAGILGFVGLVAPHIIRHLVGDEALPLLLGSAMGGAVLVTICDTAARTLFAPYELPVGILLSAIGAPFFLFLLLRRKGRRHGDDRA